MSDPKFDPIKELRNTISQGLRTISGAMPFPLVDIYETDTDVIVQTEPIIGLNLSELEVVMEGETLTLRGKTTVDADISDAAYLHRELVYGDFERKLHIPRQVDSDKATATYRGHVLKITLPKLQQAGGSRIISVTPVD